MKPNTFLKVSVLGLVLLALFKPRPSRRVQDEVRYPQALRDKTQSRRRKNFGRLHREDQSFQGRPRKAPCRLRKAVAEATTDYETRKGSYKKDLISKLKLEEWPCRCQHAFPNRADQTLDCRE